MKTFNTAVQSGHTSENGIHSNDNSFRIANQHHKCIVTASPLPTKPPVIPSPTSPFRAVLQQTAANFAVYTSLIQSGFSRNGNCPWREENRKEQKKYSISFLSLTWKEVFWIYLRIIMSDRNITPVGQDACTKKCSHIFIKNCFRTTHLLSVFYQLHNEYEEQ